MHVIHFHAVWYALQSLHNRCDVFMLWPRSSCSNSPWFVVNIRPCLKRNRKWSIVKVERKMSVIPTSRSISRMSRGYWFKFWLEWWVPSFPLLQMICFQFLFKLNLSPISSVKTLCSGWWGLKQFLLCTVSTNVKLSLQIYMLLEKLHLWAGCYYFPVK